MSSTATLIKTIPKQNIDNKMNNLNNNNNNNNNNVNIKKTNSTSKGNFCRTSKISSTDSSSYASSMASNEALEKNKTKVKNGGKVNSHKNRSKGNNKTASNDPNFCQTNSSSGLSDDLSSNGKKTLRKNDFNHSTLSYYLYIYRLM